LDIPSHHYKQLCFCQHNSKRGTSEYLQKQYLSATGGKARHRTEENFRKFACGSNNLPRLGHFVNDRVKKGGDEIRSLLEMK
jgi:hypothetical protein